MAYNLEEEKEVEVKSVDIYPVKKGKRTLLYLCDLIIVFFFSFLFYAAAVVPISAQVTNESQRLKEENLARVERNNILFYNDLLYRDEESNDLSKEMAYTFEQYARYLCSATYSVAHPDVFTRYFIDIKNYDFQVYKEHILNSDTKLFFDREELNNENVVLRGYFIDQFNPLFQGDELLGEAKKNYESFYNVYFLNMYSHVLSDIQKNDLGAHDVEYTYNHYQKILVNFENYFSNLIVADSYISYVLAVTVCFLVIPMISKNRKTLSMMFMRLERVSVSTLELKSRKTVFGNFIYQAATNLWLVYFVASVSAGFAYALGLPVVFPLSLSSLVLMFVSLIIMLFDKYNRPLSDKFSDAVVLTSQSLDEIYRARGYDI